MILYRYFLSFHKRIQILKMLWYFYSTILQLEKLLRINKEWEKKLEWLRINFKKQQNFNEFWKICQKLFCFNGIKIFRTVCNLSLQIYESIILCYTVKQSDKYNYFYTLGKCVKCKIINFNVRSLCEDGFLYSILNSFPESL